MKSWFGTLTLNNIEFVAQEILERLEGKKYTFCAAYEYKQYRPEVHVDQELTDGTNGSPLSVYKEDNYAGFNFCDTYGVWGLSTSRKDDTYDPTFSAPYVVLDWNQVEITQRTGAGMLAHWTIKVQGEQ